MRRSTQVAAPILASLAAALLSGCHTTEPQRCVDEQNHVVDAKFCSGLPANATQPLAGSPQNNGGYYNDNGVFMPHYFRYYYGGMWGGGYNTPITGGTYAPLSGHTYGFGSGATSSGTSRGGFGSSFGHSSSSGGHGGGGE